jgi:hypothetical protein
MRRINKELKAKIAGLAISLLLVVLILSIFSIPETTAMNVRLNSGMLTLENTTVYEGSLVNFTNISFTIPYDEIESITQLNFSIFNNETDAYVAHVSFTVNGNTIQEKPSGAFSITDSRNTGGTQIIHPAHGYAPETMTYTDLTYYYDISYKTLALGTFYAKLILSSSDEIFDSNKSATFTVTTPAGFLFDVNLELTLPSVYIGENNTALIDLTNVGAEGVVNAKITRNLYYGDILIWSNVTYLNISGKKSFSATIPTEGLEPGEYRYEVIHEYGADQFATASQTFIVKERPQPGPQGELPNMIIIIISIIIIIVIITLLFLKGILFFAKGKNRKYFIIYKHDDQVIYQKLQEVLFGNQRFQLDRKQTTQPTGVLKDMDYENPKEGVLLFTDKRGMKTILPILEQHNARYYAGVLIVREKKHFPE